MAQSTARTCLELGEEQPKEKAGSECLTRVWSVQTVIALLCLFCILATAVSTEVMGTVACDSGLDDTRATMDASTSALTSTAQTSLTRVSSELMVYITSGVSRLIEKHMRGALEEHDRTAALLHNEYRFHQKNSSEWLRTILPRLLHQVSTVSEGSATLALSVWGGNYGATMALAAKHNIDLPGLSQTDITALYFEPGFSAYASVTPVTGYPLINDTQYPHFPLQSTVPDFEFIQLARSPMLGPGESVFPVIAPISNFVGYAITSKHPDYSGSQSQMEVAVFVGLGEIQSFLTEVTLSAGRINSNAIMRAFSCIASTWMAERMKDFGAPGSEEVDQTGLLTGVSAGNATEAHWGLDNMFGFERYLYRPRYAVNATDPYISAVAVAINGSYVTYLKRSSVLDVLVHGTVPQRHIVSCERMTLADHGLDWWITVSIDAESVLGDVQRESAAVGMEIEEDKQRVADDIASQKVISRSIIAGIAVGLVVLSAVTSFIILRPIKALQQKMELVAGMQLDNMETESTSTFYELRHMQCDFRKMVHNLLEFRAYVPSSVLESSGYVIGADGGRFVTAPPTGKVAIVFTDIRGSTPLWKKSPADMNVAMEVHNEVIREACVEHSGYEVKTIGDAFMMSFSCPVDAARFALDVQTKLAKRVWPSGLELPPAGLVVRIGVNYGPTIAEENPVTGRVDYRGSTVNLASRVEGKARPGTVCITSDTCAAIRSDMDKLGEPVLANHGVHDIKGLGDGHELFTLVSQQQRNRLIDAETDTEYWGMVRNTAPSVSGSHTGDAASVVSKNSQTPAVLDGGKRTALQLQKTQVTVAVCRLVHDGRDSVLFDNCNIMVRAAVEAAHATDGVISNVTGCSLSVLWNASKRCLMHTTAALSFASEMKKLQQIMQVGLATGTVLHGNVGTRTSRFATTFGVPLDAAEAMTEHAQRLGVYCLHADCSHDKRLQADVTVRSCLRLVDAWLDERRERPIQIYEVHMSLLERAMQSWALTMDAVDKVEDSDYVEEHTLLVQDALFGGDGIAQLVSLAEHRPDDLVLQRVARMISLSSPTEGHRCIVEFTTYNEIPIASRRSPAVVMDAF